MAYARRVLESGSERRAAARVAAALGRGVAGLVNAHDPGIVTLAGLAPVVRRAAPEAFADAFHGGLMAFHRADPPRLAEAVHGVDGPVRGALAVAFDEITSPASLACWADGPRSELEALPVSG